MTLSNSREPSRAGRDRTRGNAHTEPSRAGLDRTAKLARDTSKQSYRNRLIVSDPERRPPMAQLMAWALAQSPQALARNAAPGVSQAVSTLAMKLALVALAHHADDTAQTFVSAQTVGEALSPNSTPRSQANAGKRAIAGLIARGLVVVVDDPGNAPRTLELQWPDRWRGGTTANASRSRPQTAGGGTTANASESAGDSSGGGTSSGTTDNALTSDNATEVMKLLNKELSLTSDSADAGVGQAHYSPLAEALREAAQQRDDNARIEAERAQLEADRQASEEQAKQAKWQQHRDSEHRTIASVVAGEASKRHGIDYQQALTALLGSDAFRDRCTPQLYRVISNPEHPDRQRAIERLADRELAALIAHRASA